MAGRKMARRLDEVARDPGGCTGVRELAEWALRAEGDGADLADLEEAIVDLTDRIEAEMVELPRDRDGVPIHVGDTVYLDDGRKAEVTHIDLMWGTSCIVCFASGKDHDCFPSGISHTGPDSWESIADELDEMVDAADSADDSCLRLADLALRIRKLAESDGENPPRRNSTTSDTNSFRVQHAFDPETDIRLTAKEGE